MDKFRNVVIAAGLCCFFTVQGFAQTQMPDNILLNKNIITRLEFKDAKLIDAARLIAEASGLNIVVTPEAYDKPVQLYLGGVSAREAIKILCKLNNLWFVEEDNAVRIMLVEDYGRELTIRRDEKTFVYKLKYASCLAVAELIQSLFGDRIEYEEPEELESYGHVGTDKQGDTGVSGKFGRDRYLSNDYRQDDFYRSRTKRHNGTDFAFRMRKEAVDIEKELTSKRIERFEEKRKGDSITIEDVLDLAKEKAVVTLGVFLRNNSIACRSVDLRILRDIDDLIKKIDTPTPQVLLEGKILEITLTDDFKSFFDFDFTSDSGDSSAQIGNFPTLDSATFIYQTLHNELQARMELLEKNGQAKIIGTPMILCANNAPGEFFIGEERPIVINYEQEIREFDERTTETVRPVIELRDIGTNLMITPSINEDRTVTMRFLAEVDSVNIEGAMISIVNQKGELVALPIDTVDSSRVENIILAKDSVTLAVGGLIREIDMNSEYKVPVLGDIPLLGLMFKKKEIVKKKTETVFLITPHLMMVPDEGQGISEGTISRVSGHPYIKQNQEKLLQYDENTKKLKPVIESRYKNSIAYIVHVDIESNFAIIDLGSEDGVKKDDVFLIYRGDKLIGKVKVGNVYLLISSVYILGDITMDEIQEGDEICRMDELNSGNTVSTKNRRSHFR